MSKLDDVIVSIHSIIEKLDDALQANSAGADDIDDALSIVASSDMTSLVECLSSLRDGFDGLGGRLSGGKELAEAMLNKAVGLRDGT